jgi:hypothetical protein
MIKLSLMISHMSLMINVWSLSHRVLNDYCHKQFVHNDFKGINVTNDNDMGFIHLNVHHDL